MTKACGKFFLSAGKKKTAPSALSLCGASFLALLLTAAWVSPAPAADFQIQPMTMYLGRNAKSGVFSVINTGKEKIDFQVSLQEWSQDETGKDVYVETKDIVFFPKVMSVEPNAQRAIRIGLKAPIALKEKTYRIFVQEIPTPKKSAEDPTAKIRAGVSIAFRFAMPIFVKPAQPQESFAIAGIDMAKETVQALIKNTGNVHVKLRNVKFSGRNDAGEEIFSKEVAGWYILQGLSLPYKTDIPPDLCGKLVKIDVSAQTEKDTANGTFNVQSGMCAQ